MKNFYACLVFAFACNICPAQWQLSLTLKENESIADMSSPSGGVAWIVTTAFYIYTTADGGAHWDRSNSSMTNRRVTSSIAFLSSHLFLSPAQI